MRQVFVHCAILTSRRRAHLQMGTRDTHNANSGNNPTSLEHEIGPHEWLFPMRESTYTKLVPRDKAEGRAAVSEPSATADESDETFTSRLRPGEGENVLATVAQDLWVDRLAKYKRRKAARVQEISARAAVPRGRSAAPPARRRPARCRGTAPRPFQRPARPCS